MKLLPCGFIISGEEVQPWIGFFKVDADFFESCERALTSFFEDYPDISSGATVVNLVDRFEG